MRRHPWSDESIREAMDLTGLSGPVAWEWAHGVAETLADLMADGIPEDPDPLILWVADEKTPATIEQAWDLFEALDLSRDVAELVWAGETEDEDEIVASAIYRTAQFVAESLLNGPPSGRRKGWNLTPHG